MNILRSIARWLCAIGLSLTLGAWIVTATTNATALNRDTTKQWLAQSGLYNAKLGDIFQVQPATPGTATITKDAFSQALTTTFTPDYLKQSSETILDASYDWLDGKSQAITFTIPVQDKAEEFKTNLAAAIEPKLEALPTCTSRLGNTTGDITCIPAGLTAAQYAQQLARPSNSSNFLKEPLTAQTFAQNTGAPNLSWLPQSVQIARTLVIVLPIIIVLLAGLFVLLSSDRLRGLMLVGRQMVLSSILLLVGGLIMLYVGSTINLAAAAEGNNQFIADIINPMAHTIIPGIGGALSLFSGIVVAVGVVVWIISHILINRRPEAFVGPLQQPAAQAPATPQPTPAPSQPQQQVRPQPAATQPPAPAQKIPPAGPPKPPIIQ